MKARQAILFGMALTFVTTGQFSSVRGQNGQESTEQPSVHRAIEAAGFSTAATTTAAHVPAMMLPALQEELEDTIESKLGARYRYGATGKSAYDCSGLVWSAFHDIGLDIARLSSREMYLAFPAASPEEEKQLGTLVFFHGLKHVGIVRDATSFYHASRRHGVILSKFAGYWEDRVEGFRTVPVFPVAAP